MDVPPIPSESGTLTKLSSEEFTGSSYKEKGPFQPGMPKLKFHPKLYLWFWDRLKREYHVSLCEKKILPQNVCDTVLSFEPHFLKGALVEISGC